MNACLRKWPKTNEVKLDTGTRANRTEPTESDGIRTDEIRTDEIRTDQIRTEWKPSRTNPHGGTRNRANELVLNDCSFYDSGLMSICHFQVSKAEARLNKGDWNQFMINKSACAMAESVIVSNPHAETRLTRS